MNSSLFPFTAIIGMDLARHSLIYHAIDRTLGGTVLMGHRGCAKSTLVRAFQEILSQDDGSEAPFFEVPLGASEERLLGSVDAASLVEQGQWKEHSGLLEQAHGGVLYVDEVNLLPDHLVDQTLDAAASGRYRLEREGLSREVEARFILVGTMNPEEGDLRPQLLDRFTHGVLIRDEYTAEERREIVRARMEFEDDPQDFRSLHRNEVEHLRERIQEARTRLKSIRILEEQRVSVSERAASLGLEGIRAELGVLRTALHVVLQPGAEMIQSMRVILKKPGNSASPIDILRMMHPFHLGIPKDLLRRKPKIVRTNLLLPSPHRFQGKHEGTPSSWKCLIVPFIRICLNGGISLVFSRKESTGFWEAGG